MRMAQLHSFGWRRSLGVRFPICCSTTVRESQILVCWSRQDLVSSDIKSWIIWIIRDPWISLTVGSLYFLIRITWFDVWFRCNRSRPLFLDCFAFCLTFFVHSRNFPLPRAIHDVMAVGNIVVEWRVVASQWASSREHTSAWGLSALLLLLRQNVAHAPNGEWYSAVTWMWPLPTASTGREGHTSREIVGCDQASGGLTVLAVSPGGPVFRNVVLAQQTIKTSHEDTVAPKDLHMYLWIQNGMFLLAALCSWHELDLRNLSTYHSSGCQLPAIDSRCQGSIPSLIMCNFWYKKWHWGRFSASSSVPLPIYTISALPRPSLSYIRGWHNRPNSVRYTSRT